MESIHFMLANGAWWLYVLLVGASFALALISYRRTLPEIDNPTRWLLTVLRTVAMAAILIALFEPVFRLVRSESNQPGVALIVDGSRSMQVIWEGEDDASRRQKISDITSEAGVKTIRVFSSDVKEVNSADSIMFTGERTDIAAMLNEVSNKSELERPGVIILVSDGNANSGDNPVYIADKSGIGVYTIGVGDTIPKRDAGIVSLVASGIAVVNKPVNVAITTRMSSMPSQSVIVVLEEGGVEIGRDTVSTTFKDGQATSDLAWIPKHAGIRSLTARILPFEGDFTSANNVIREDVEVRTNRRTIVVFAGAPGPDVTFFKSELERDPSVSVKLFIQKQGGGFYDQQPGPDAFNDAVSCVLIGFPTAGTPVQLVESVAAACGRGLALMFIASRDVDYANLGSLKSVLPFQVASTRQTEILITPDVSIGAVSDPLLKINGDDNDAQLWNTLPPIWRTETFVTPAPGAVVLTKIRTGNVPINQPLTLKREHDQSRSIAVLGYGLYRWKLMGEGPRQARGEQTADVFGSFVRNSVSWLSVRDDARRIRIRSTRQRYAAGEYVAFMASILDETFAPVTGADVRVTVSGPNGKDEIVLGEIGGGRYSTVTGAMPEGEYSCIGIAAIRGKEIGRDLSRFSVGALHLEDASTSVNTEMLSALAQQTGGTYRHVSKYGEVIQAALADPRLRPVAVTTERDVMLWHLPWLLSVAILALTIEWVLRKRRGLI